MPSKAEKISGSDRAGIIFPPSRITKVAIENSGVTRGRKGGVRLYSVPPDTSVFLAAATEYLIGEILEEAATQARESKAKRIKPRHIVRGCLKDAELSAFWQSSNINTGNLPIVKFTMDEIKQHYQTFDERAKINRKRRKTGTSRDVVVSGKKKAPQKKPKKIQEEEEEDEEIPQTQEPIDSMDVNTSISNSREEEEDVEDDQSGELDDQSGTIEEDESE